MGWVVQRGTRNHLFWITDHCFGICQHNNRTLSIVMKTERHTSALSRPQILLRYSGHLHHTGPPGLTVSCDSVQHQRKMFPKTIFHCEMLFTLGDVVPLPRLSTKLRSYMNANDSVEPCNKVICHTKHNNFTFKKFAYELNTTYFSHRVRKCTFGHVRQAEKR